MAVEKTDIITVKKLLQEPKLQIPDYQRPYTWTEKNVNQLINDILFHKDKSAYRLGTLVVHHSEDGEWNIVDGQQRTITLILIAYALVTRKELFDIEAILKVLMGKLKFPSDISKTNIQKNYKAIEKRAGEFDDDTILFFLNKCELVLVVLTEISEAFQFFDSQNARGKGLYPHDLLKAFHLRAMDNSPTEQRDAVETWEDMDKEKLAKLFAQYLYRIRNWSKGKSAKYFSMDDVDVFKGVNPKDGKDYPFAKLFCIAAELAVPMAYPFQLDQTIVNGKRFFDMVTYYDQLVDYIKDYIKESDMNAINDYRGNRRIGDRYIKNLFYCGLIYYIDRFGKEILSEKKNLSKIAIGKIFMWAYTLRLELERVQLKSVDNYALNNDVRSKIPLFKEIRESIDPHDILNIKPEQGFQLAFQETQKELPRDSPSMSTNEEIYEIGKPFLRR